MFRAILNWFRNRRSRSFQAVVLLLDAPRVVTLDHARSVLAGLDLAATMDEKEVGDLHCEINGFSITIRSFPMPYRTLKKPPNDIDLRLADAMRTHKAFLSIDVHESPEGQTLEDARDILGRIAASLVDASTLVIWDVGSGFLAPATPDVVEILLKEGLNSEAFETFSPVVMVNPRDRKMKAAIREAVTRWPEFVQAFPNRAADEPCLAKVCLSNGKDKEHIWLEVQDCGLDFVTGVVANRPYDLPNIKENDVITHPASGISDWMIIIDGELVGGFLERILHG